MLSYGRKRSVILEATVHDKDCVLANVLAAHFLSSSDPSRVHHHLQAAKAGLVSFYFYFYFICKCSFWRFLFTNCLYCFDKDRATPYEKAVFDAISCLMSNDRDDNVAVELHYEVFED